MTNKLEYTEYKGNPRILFGDLRLNIKKAEITEKGKIVISELWTEIGLLYKHQSPKNNKELQAKYFPMTLEIKESAIKCGTMKGVCKAIVKSKVLAKKLTEMLNEIK